MKGRFCEKQKTSATYKVLIAFVLYTVFYCYYNLFFANGGGRIAALVPIGIGGLLLLWVTYLIAVRTRTKPTRFIAAVFVFALVLTFTIIKTNSGYENTVQMLTLIASLYLISIEPLKRKEPKKLFAILLIGSVIIMLNTATGGVTQEGKINPNTGGFISTALYCVGIGLYVKYKKVHYFIISAACFALQFVYGSRSSLGGCILYTLLTFIVLRSSAGFSAKRAFIVSCLLPLIGILFAYLYAVVLYDWLGSGTVQIFNKDLFTGREVIWRNIFDKLKDDFFLGKGNHVNEDLFLAGHDRVVMIAHNQPLGILASFGLMGFLLFYGLLSFVAAKPYKTGKSKIGKLGFVFFVTVSVMGYLEINFFSANCLFPIIICYGILNGIVPREDKRALYKIESKIKGDYLYDCKRDNSGI